MEGKVYLKGQEEKKPKWPWKAFENTGERDGKHGRVQPGGYPKPKGRPKNIHARSIVQTGQVILRYLAV